MNLSMLTARNEFVAILASGVLFVGFWLLVGDGWIANVPGLLRDVSWLGIRHGNLCSPDSMWTCRPGFRASTNTRARCRDAQIATIPLQTVGRQSLGRRHRCARRRTHGALLPGREKAS